WPPVPAFGQQVDAFLLHPFGDSNKSIETGVQSSLQPVYAMSTAGNRIIETRRLASVFRLKWLKVPTNKGV
ncbi:MAG: hypothetical protein ACK511_07325, partial [Burkholderiales bacterium]